MKLIVGLGNPGSQYAKTRHNIGWMVLDLLADKDKWQENKKLKALFLKKEINGLEVGLLKPLTYMNESGLAVACARKKYNIQISDILIVHDDKDLPLGEIKLQTDRGSAGHNGVKSIIEHLGTQDFTRMRIGTASANTRQMADTSKFVLSRFGLLEKKKLKQILAEAVNMVESWTQTKDVY